ncbi:2431_t:CDS:2 [Funneliformis mosseae]|uniref:2431_t:CDS:1 n=1 Tax=Funneliformis mosseae TaxID=27381 RepID=A0A9N9FBC3_FUNMO|nr:2431_t:CDS:2 [Funneliformis mosseae]
MQTVTGIFANIRIEFFLWNRLLILVNSTISTFFGRPLKDFVYRLVSIQSQS